MIETDWFTFHAIPKVGNSWFMSTLRDAGVHIAQSNSHVPGTVPGKPSVTIYREPAMWLRSYFNSVQGQLDMPVIDKFMALRNGRRQMFEEFGWQYVRQMPGHISRSFLQYEAEIELRTEHLSEDAARMLEVLSVPCDIEFVRREPARNTSGEHQTIPPDLRAAINAADSYTGERSPAPALSRGLTLKGSV